MTTSKDPEGHLHTLSQLLHDLWGRSNFLAKALISVTSAILAVASMALSFRVGYIWSLRDFSVFASGTVRFSNYIHPLAFAFFVPGAISTLAYGFLRLGLRQITARRTKLIALLLPLRRFVVNDKLITLLALWVVAAVLIYFPIDYFVEINTVLLFVYWASYLAIYAGEFRFSIVEVFSPSFYNFFNRKSVSDSRVLAAQIGWTAFAITSTSFVIGFYGLRLSMASCVYLNLQLENDLAKYSIIAETGDALVLVQCNDHPSVVKMLWPVHRVTVLSKAKVSSISQSDN
ncbi:hypothetical protein [Rhodobacter ferrooxidans]|uniref:Uncharacterized protein n=1 Tax=Rhodobacter ferrooxidans TaxID=371731 RepID=C8S4M8_9RHOB|nr:hypothetical protein [Rhodobacter sp. SW2]EEW24027.1 hypothetical protein Rsw2DRAFT_3006 [Rhodobacter sp. SW2]